MFSPVESIKIDQYRRAIVRLSWVMIVLLCMPSACTLHSGKPSSSQPSPSLGTRETPISSTEQQLLTTIKNAEGLGPGNPLLLSSLYSLATYYEERKEYTKAAAQYERTLQLKEEANGPNHPDVAAILQRYARLLKKANKGSEAENLLLRADAILTQTSAPLPRP